MKKTTKKTANPLQLSRETLRNLDGGQLVHVAGGVAISQVCGSVSNTCPTVYACRHGN
jgi:hypothetical protein